MSRLEGIDVHPEGLGHVLYDYRLAVPTYQRSYAWKEDHVRELFQDYRRAIDDNSEYFLGTVVVAKKGDGERPEIVDGQQRLATTSILLAAIRDRFLEMDDEEGAGIVETKYLLSKELRDREPVPHLLLNEFDGDFFTKCVLTRPGESGRDQKPTRISHRLIAAAAKIAKAHVADILKGLNRGDQIDVLNRWVQFVHDKAQIIWLTVVDYEDAYVIFETLNDRGLELSIADLLKNYLFWKAGNRVKEVQQMWTLMAGILESVSDDEITTYYIHQLWSSIHGVTRKRELFRAVRKQITNKQSAVDLVKRLGEDAHLYAALRNPDHNSWAPFGTSTRECLHELQQIRVWQIRTLLLAVLSTFPEKEAKKVFPLAVSWSVRFLVAGGSPGNVESHYARQAVRIRKGELKDAKELARAMASVAPDDTTFQNAFSTLRVSADYLARYLLRKLNDAVGSQGGSLPLAAGDEAKVNLEHIFPKNPSADWSHIGAEDAEEILKRLGNMALVISTNNSKLGNVGFAQKAQAFKKEPLPLTQEVGKHGPQWGPAEVDAFQKKLAAIAVKVWRLDV